MKKEKLKINFLGFNIECENPSLISFAIIAIVLLFLIFV